MLTSKQRAYLRGLANSYEAILQIGKGGVTPQVVDAVSEALEARELIKITVLESCEVEAKEAAELLAGRARADIVQVIGRKIVLFRRSKENESMLKIK